MHYTGIERAMIECPQDTKPGLVTRPCHSTPGDRWVQNYTKHLDKQCSGGCPLDNDLKVAMVQPICK